MDFHDDSSVIRKRKAESAIPPWDGWDGPGRLWDGCKSENRPCLPALGRWDGRTPPRHPLSPSPSSSSSFSSSHPKFKVQRSVYFGLFQCFNHLRPSALSGSGPIFHIFPHLAASSHVSCPRRRRPQLQVNAGNCKQLQVTATSVEKDFFTANPSANPALGRFGIPNPSVNSGLSRVVTPRKSKSLGK
jgi:hypothetical protein